MSAETGLKTIEFDPIFQAQALELGLVMPTIRIADKLDIRLARIDRTIECNDAQLFYGTKAAGLENIIAITIDSLPKDKPKSNPVIEYILTGGNNNNALIRTTANPNAEDFTEKKLNQAFWLGVLVVDEIAEYGVKDLTNRYKELRTKQGDRGYKLLWGAAGVSFSDEMLNYADVVSNTEKLDAVSVIAGTAMLASGLYNMFRGRPNTKNEVTDFIADTKKDQALDQARDYPVFSHGQTIFA